MKKRASSGQSSLEFLMTYGWAILIIVVAVLVIWQWGLFSIGETVTPGSFGFWGVGPKDSIMHSNGVMELSLINNLGANITILYYNVSIGQTSCSCEDAVCAQDGCVHGIKPEDVLHLSVANLDKYPSGKRFEAAVFLRYNDSRTGDVEHVSSGKIWGNTED